jgi:hypothetical protein
MASADAAVAATGEAVGADAARAPQRALTGYIDAVANNRVYGWAWDPRRPEARIAIRLVVADDIVAAVLADQPREDLVKGGIGDGAHAFEIEIPENAPAQSLRIVAVCNETGEMLALPHRQTATGGGTGDAEVRQALRTLHQALKATQRQVAALAEEVEASRAAGAAAPPEPDAAPLDRLGALEAAIYRIDQSLSARLPEHASKSGATDWYARGMALGAFLLALAALVLK